MNFFEIERGKYKNDWAQKFWNMERVNTIWIKLKTLQT